MRQASCERESEVAAAAARPSGLDPRLREHIAVCRDCGEAAAVAAFLGVLARQPDDRPLGDPGDLYRRARLVEKLFRDAAPVQRTLGRLALAEVVGTLVSGLALLSWVGWVVADLWQRLPPWPGPEWTAVLAGPLAAGAILLLFAFGASLPLLLAED